MAGGSTPAVPSGWVSGGDAVEQAVKSQLVTIRPAVAMTERRRDRLMVPSCGGMSVRKLRLLAPVHKAKRTPTTLFSAHAVGANRAASRKNAPGVRAYTARPTEGTERTGSPQRNGATEIKRRCAGSTGRPAQQADERDWIDRENEHLRIRRVLVFTFDPIAPRRFATPVEPSPSVQS